MSNRNTFVVQKDVTVAGGGLAGVCAAIAAAREGADVALIHNRPVLGGNASSEIRIWAVGATAMGNNRYAAESGIIGELDLENLYRNPEGNPYLWDVLLLDTVRREQKIELFLNTDVQEVEGMMDEISSVIACQAGSERKLAFQSKFFIDCTGDGSLGCWAGAEYMHGKEGRTVFGEDMAPEQSGPYTMGSTLLFYVRETGRKVTFIPPDFAYPPEYIKNLLTSIKKTLDIKASGCDLWWIEYGGELDTIKDNESIREELQRLIYGIWNYVKNSGEFCVDTLTLEWVGSIPAKRESRRFVGSLVLTQNHILRHQRFEDAVCYGGWPIDVHPEGGIYSGKSSCKQKPTGIYQIPLRCLYSKNIKNLLFAGRNISASHLAFASTRVMKTCALTGQAAGTAAAFAARIEKCPFEFSLLDIKDVQQSLIKEDVWLQGLENPDTANIAKEAEVTASGFREFSSELVYGRLALEEDTYFLMPALTSLQTLQLMLGGTLERAVQIEVYLADALKDYSELFRVGVFAATCTEHMEWVTFQCNLSLNGTRNMIVKIPAQKGGFLGIAKESCCGVIGSYGSLKGMKLFHPCFRLTPEPAYFSPHNVINGIARPEKQPNIWVSNHFNGKSTWIALTFKETKEIREIQILFNPDFNRDYNQVRPDYYKNGWDRMPEELVRSFLLKARQPDGNFAEIVRIENQIKRQFTLKTMLKTDCIKAEFFKTYGSVYAQVFEIKVYQ